MPADGPADPDGSWRDVPLPPDPGLAPDAGAFDDPWPLPETDPDDGERLAETPAPPWPPLPATITQRTPVFGGAPPHGGPSDRGSPRWDLSALSVPGGGRPPPELLDLTISWDVLLGRSTTPAQLSRIGPITAIQALPLAAMAALHPHTTWRVILTDPGGVALAVERVRRRSRSAAEAGPGDGDSGGGDSGGRDGWPPGVVGRVTVVLPLSAVNQTAAGQSPPGRAAGRRGTIEDRGQGPGIRPAIWRAAIRAARRVLQAAAEDATASGLCAHGAATAAYRPTASIREFVEARDQTCRQPTCRQPARRADLDHTRPWDQGGRTCSCNLGPRCRTHHKIKQLPGWTLTQPDPGVFHLTTPAGRTYITRPDAYPT